MNAKTAKPTPLGRGLSALFGDAEYAFQPKSHTTVTHDKTAAQKTLPIEWIQPGTYQPRRRFDDESIKGLAESIKERGVVQPLMVRPVEGTRNLYEIIAGERRWRAAQLAGLHEVPVIVREFSDREAMEVGLIENVQREDLSPIEEAEGYQRLIDEFHHSQDDLARIVGKSRSHIANMIRLLALPPAVKQMVDSGQLSMGHARAIITASDPLALAQEIVKKGMSVRQAEALARRESEGRRAKRRRKSSNTDPNIIALENEIERIIGLRVKINPDTKVDAASGTMTIYYSTLEQLENIIRKLKS